MISLPKELLVKYGSVAVLISVAFLAGRYTTKSSITKEIETQYQQRLSEQEQVVQNAYEQRLLIATIAIKSEYDSKIAKNIETTKVTVTNKDGSSVVTEKTKTQENSQSIVSTNTDIKTDSSSTASASSATSNSKSSEVTQSKKEISKTTSSPSVRLYGTVLIDYGHPKQDNLFGFGTSYDFGVINVGTIGLYRPSDSKGYMGITLGVNL